MDNHASNGHAPPVREQLREARDQVRLARARAELLQYRASDFVAKWGARQMAAGDLQESYDGYSGNAWGDLVDPLDAFRDRDLTAGGFPYLDRGQSRRDGYFRPFLWTDLDLDLQRSVARHIATKNRVGIGVLETLQDYVVRTGFKYEAAPREHIDDEAAPALAGVVNAFIKEFHAVNAWPARERSVVLRSARDGEVFLRHFAQPDGSTWVRFVEPETIWQPPGTPVGWSWGLLHAPGDMERIIAASVAYGGPGTEEIVRFDGDEITHLKRNTDECVKRGLSDFYCTGAALAGVDKLVNNMVVAGGIQAAIAWIEQYLGPNVGGVQGQVAAARDLNRPNYPNPVTGKSANYTRYEAGSVPKIGVGREFKPPPVATGASVHVQIEQAALRSIGVRWHMPEYMVSGDSSNANFASTLVSGAPFVTHVECEQAVVYAPYFLRSHWVAVKNWCDAGRCRVNGRAFTFEEVKALLDIHATPPAVAIANRKEEADIDHQDLADGVTSRQIVAAKRGNDFAKVEQDLREAPVQAPAPSPATPGGPSPAAPQPQPPGGRQPADGPFFPRLAS